MPLKIVPASSRLYAVPLNATLTPCMDSTETASVNHPLSLLGILSGLAQVSHSVVGVFLFC